MPVQVRQEVLEREGQVVEGEAGGAADRADDGALFLGRPPGQLARPGGMVEAVFRAALAPLADGLGADPEAPGQHARGLAGSGDLGPDRRGGAGFRVDRRHQHLLARAGLASRSKRQA